MNDLWFLTIDRRQQGKALEGLGFTFSYQLDPEEIDFNEGQNELVGRAYDWSFWDCKNVKIFEAIYKDAVFSFCLEPQAYEDPRLQALASNPKTLFEAAKKALKAIVQDQKLHSPKQLGLFS